MKRRRFQYRIGRFGLVAESQRRCGPDAWFTYRIHFIGYEKRAQRIHKLLNKNS